MTHQSNLRAERKAKNLCATCGLRPPRAGRVSCAKCLRYSNRLRTKRENARKAKGLCPDCGKRPAEPDRTSCWECQSKFNALHRAMIQRRKAKGICAVCGRPSSPFATCLKCRDRYRDTRKKRKASQR